MESYAHLDSENKDNRFLIITNLLRKSDIYNKLIRQILLKNICNFYVYLPKTFKNMGVGANLRKLRNKTKYSQQDISDLLDIDRNTYANWEKETHDVKSEHIPELAKIFDVEIKDLFENDRKTIEINISKQVQKYNDGSNNHNVVLVLPNKEMVEKLVEVLKDKF